jgi:hypothetical protein
MHDGAPMAVPASVRHPAPHAPPHPARSAGAAPADDLPRIVSPADGAVYFRDPRLADASAIRFQARDPQPADIWVLDGRRIEARADGSALWAPAPGAHRLQLRRGASLHEIRFAVH